MPFIRITTLEFVLMTLLAGSDRLNEFLQLICVLQTDHSSDLLSIPHPHQHGHGADIEVKGQVVVFVNVHLEVDVRSMINFIIIQEHFNSLTNLRQGNSFHFRDDAFNAGCQHLAGTAPSGKVKESGQGSDIRQ